MAIKRKKKSRKPATSIAGVSAAVIGGGIIGKILGDEAYHHRYKKGAKLSPYDEKRGTALVKGNIKKRRQKDVRRLLDSAAGTKDTGARRKKQSRAVHIMGNMLKDRKK